MGIHFLKMKNHLRGTNICVLCCYIFYFDEKSTYKNVIYENKEKLLSSIQLSVINLDKRREKATDLSK